MHTKVSAGIIGTRACANTPNEYKQVNQVFSFHRSWPITTIISLSHSKTYLSTEQDVEQVSNFTWYSNIFVYLTFLFQSEDFFTFLVIYSIEIIVNEIMKIIWIFFGCKTQLSQFFSYCRIWTHSPLQMSASLMMMRKIQVLKR